MWRPTLSFVYAALDTLAPVAVAAASISTNVPVTHAPTVRHVPRMLTRFLALAYLDIMGMNVSTIQTSVHPLHA
jgi:hypothetical protein